MKRAMRRAYVFVTLPLLVILFWLGASGADAPRVRLNAVSAGPRELQPETQEAIARSYGQAWEVLRKALAENRAELLDRSFVGGIREQLARAIEQQGQSGIRRRLVDRGHAVDALLYSPEGLSVQLRDRAQLELQILDGETVIHREQVTVHYIAVLTPAEASWKVRVLQAVPK
jgi:hypothetical protein